MSKNPGIACEGWSIHREEGQLRRKLEFSGGLLLIQAASAAPARFDLHAGAHAPTWDPLTCAGGVASSPGILGESTLAVSICDAVAADRSSAGRVQPTIGASIRASRFAARPRTDTIA